VSSATNVAFGYCDVHCKPEVQLLELVRKKAGRLNRGENYFMYIILAGGGAIFTAAPGGRFQGTAKRAAK
jgi:hypothetical protein